MPKTAPTPTKMLKLRMFYLRDSESGLAVQLLDKSLAGLVTRTVWLPISQMYEVEKAPKADKQDYPQWTMKVPEWLAEQKNLTEFAVKD